MSTCAFTQRKEPRAIGDGRGKKKGKRREGNGENPAGGEKLARLSGRARGRRLVEGGKLICTHILAI